MGIRDFGVMPDGANVQSVTISNADLHAEILTLGATIRDLRLRGFGFGLVLGLNSVADYVAHSPYFGIIAGRCANRIAHGRFSLDGKNHQLEMAGADTAKQDPHHLHGGPNGFGRRNWKLVSHGADFVTLALHAPAGDAGYPGAVEVTCTYRLKARNLVCDLTATTDAPTLMNLAQHSYFNLDGSPTIDAHRVQIFSDHITATDAEMIPTGKLKPVRNTTLDFQHMRELGSHMADHNYCLAPGRYSNPQLAARVATPAVSMAIYSTEPGIQFFTADSLSLPVDGLDGRRYASRAGLCLEPQF